MNINENTRLIDLKVSDLLTILKETNPPMEGKAPTMGRPGEDEIGGYEIAEKVTGYARQTLYQLKSEGKIPYIGLPNGGVRFSKNAILEWLLSHKKLSDAEVADRAEDFVLKRKLRRK
ncbi:helix-turn-helix transcriptional regulator [Pedobacter frigoris]|uniref:Helix-turn-helix domain-containing protein n=1 Tax=Pedobacter frigoris TaxID=2571272 RepID=A0A4U1CMC4_9SPHI|nr:helix-turn-helix domain-containing protein [Pedobacter frigoris]TKC07511.1 helix-turn-helix domain-containing protein [Pedobacter frigoris]